MSGMLIQDTTREEREEIIRKALNRGGGGCESYSSCGPAAVTPMQCTSLTSTVASNALFDTMDGNIVADRGYSKSA